MVLMICASDIPPWRPQIDKKVTSGPRSLSVGEFTLGFSIERDRERLMSPLLSPLSVLLSKCYLVNLTSSSAYLYVGEIGWTTWRRGAVGLYYLLKTSCPCSLARHSVKKETRISRFVLAMDKTSSPSSV